ncbi:aldolase/citrate lyase family protein [Shigella boydii]
MLDVEGVDGIFIGPANLSTDMGYAGNPQHRKYRSPLSRQSCKSAKRASAGDPIANERLAKRYLELGALFVAVGVDTTLLARAAEALAARFGARPRPLSPACLNAECAFIRSTAVPNC